MSPLDWDACTYDRIADPQEAWAREIIARMDLGGSETVLDAGCGSGRVTRLLLEALPQGRVIAVDASPSMVRLAGEALLDSVRCGQVEISNQNLLELTLAEPVDAVFSCAVFHHIHDHSLLLRRLREALKPGGRLIAQCGGEGNINDFRGLVDAICAREPFAEHLAAMPAPWNYASAPQSERRLLEAGFSEARCWLQVKPTYPEHARAFTESVLLNYHFQWLIQSAGEARGRQLGQLLTDEVLAGAGEPLRLDYVRLNMEAVA